ncbi:acyltransferase [Mucilaginibacter corticis]|uniref:Acyltransferase n=1 Tax=Mucilaginibacter corticis TaxID=2597670 RepID=A0A556MFG4_9SPHI|nr:acyltransferase [Mucilaginibacter corticis]
MRRFFRIAPLYYLAGLFYILVVVFNNYVSFQSKWYPIIHLSPIKLIANFTFLNGIYLPAIDYLPPGGWSVGDEMLFYLAIPLLFSKITSLKKAFLILTGSIIVSFIVQTLLYFFIIKYTHYSWVTVRGWQFYFWLPNQFPVFCFGILLFFIISSDKIKYKEWMICLSIVLIVLLSFYNYQLTFPKVLIQREYLYSAAFCFFAFSLSKTKLRFLVSPVNKFGKVSFSMYLIHFVVIDVIWQAFKLIFHDGVNSDINFIIVYGLTIFITYLISQITYRYIERKGISKGETYIEKIKQKTQLKENDISLS